MHKRGKSVEKIYHDHYQIIDTVAPILKHEEQHPVKFSHTGKNSMGLMNLMQTSWELKWQSMTAASSKSREEVE